jgi:hypothetical protein
MTDATPCRKQNALEWKALRYQSEAVYGFPAIVSME